MKPELFTLTISMSDGENSVFRHMVVMILNIKESSIEVELEEIILSVEAWGFGHGQVQRELLVEKIDHEG